MANGNGIEHDMKAWIVSGFISGGVSILAPRLYILCANGGDTAKNIMSAVRLHQGLILIAKGGSAVPPKLPLCRQCMLASKSIMSLLCLQKKKVLWIMLFARLPPPNPLPRFFCKFMRAAKNSMPCMLSLYVCSEGRFLHHFVDE